MYFANNYWILSRRIAKLEGFSLSKLFPVGLTGKRDFCGAYTYPIDYVRVGNKRLNSRVQGKKYVGPL